METLNEIMNGPGMWIASSLMMVVMLVQAILYFRLGRKEASELQIPKEKIKNSCTSAMITAIGPALAMVIILSAMIVMLGTPTAWMRINDIGAGRTELAVAEIAKSIISIAPEAEGYDEMAFSYSLWGMALNNFGWLFVSLVLTSQMGKAVEKLNTTFNPALIKLVMSGAIIGLFGYMIANSTISKDPPFMVAAVTSALTMFLLDKLLGKYKRLQELALGIAMIVGITVATIVKYQIGV